MPYNDATLVGERGMSLSGGQRARLNLARAIYSDPELILMDDPLSAVDMKVGRQLFDQLVPSVCDQWLSLSYNLEVSSLLISVNLSPFNAVLSLRTTFLKINIHPLKYL